MKDDLEGGTPAESASPATMALEELLARDDATVQAAYDSIATIPSAQLDKLTEVASRAMGWTKRHLRGHNGSFGLPTIITAIVLLDAERGPERSEGTEPQTPLDTAPSGPAPHREEP
jgi:hypothetical protein